MRKEAWDKKCVDKVLKELDAKTTTAAGPKITNYFSVPHLMPSANKSIDR
jgi:hypothetical protein